MTRAVCLMCAWCFGICCCSRLPASASQTLPPTECAATMGLAGLGGCRVALREGPLMLGCEQGLCKCEPGVLHRAPVAHQSHALRLRSA